MPLETRRTLRFNDTEWESLRIQAEKLGTDRTGYIKTIIAVDAATNIIQRLKTKTQIAIDIICESELDEIKKKKIIKSLTEKP